jgi:hypothetical protein
LSITVAATQSLLTLCCGNGRVALKLATQPFSIERTDMPTSPSKLLPRDLICAASVAGAGGPEGIVAALDFAGDAGGEIASTGSVGGGAEYFLIAT